MVGSVMVVIVLGILAGCGTLRIGRIVVAKKHSNVLSITRPVVGSFFL